MRKWIAVLAAVGLAVSATHAHAAERGATSKPLQQMIGQMIMVGFLGDTKDHAWFLNVVEQVRQGKVTGVLYLARNIRHQQAVSDMNKALNQAVETGLKPIIGVDQEGGFVQRLTPKVGFPSMPSARRVARSMEPRRAYEAYAALAQRLRKWGFNFNLGPVVDLDINPQNPIIGRLGRSFSKDPKTVAQYAAAFVEGHRKHGVLTVLKHFPGHGSSLQDSHKTVVDVSKTWQKSELAPYRELIRQGYADMVMSGHIRNKHLQPASDRHPASLSPSVLTGLLRDSLGHRGIVISDDMQMHAISQRYSFDEAIKRAVLAGTDILVFANDKNPDLHAPDRVISILTREAKTNETMRARIEASYKRIMRLKKKLSDTAMHALPSSDARSSSRAIGTAAQASKVMTPELIKTVRRTIRLGVN